VDKLDGKGKDVIKESIKKLKEIFPEIVTEGRVDFDKLKEMTGNPWRLY